MQSGRSAVLSAVRNARRSRTKGRELKRQQTILKQNLAEVTRNLSTKSDELVNQFSGDRTPPATCAVGGGDGKADQ